MEYRKYRAKTFQEAKLKMLLDVGKNAYIVSQKKVRVGGLFGLFGKLMIEITVGIVEHKDRLRLNSDIEMARKKSKERQINYYNSNNNNNIREEVSNKVHIEREAREERQERGREDKQAKSNSEDLGRELDEIKSLITMILADKNNSSKENSNALQSSPIKDSNSSDNILSKKDYSEDVNKSIELVKLFMKEEDFNDNFIEDFCSLSSTQFLLSKEKKLSVIKDKLREQISALINTSSGIKLTEGKTNVIVLVGPTGVGKTTTIAKLGAYFGVFQKKKVKLVSIDTYRVGAIQQLKLYADIMEIPFAKVNNIREFTMELNMDKYDLILVDTTGRSQRNIDEIRDIKRYLDMVEHNLHISLVLSATTKYRDIVEILDKFDILSYNNIIITKLDETNSLGQVISAIRPKNRSLTYVTFGQSVPEDIEEASKNKIFDMVLKG